MAGEYLGDFTTSNTVYVYFNTFDSNDPSASVTLTGLAVTDIEIYKNGSVTQRSSDSGYTLLDTDGIDFDGITGIHGFSIDLSDNTDAGFFATGNEYTIIVSSVTVDAATINFIAGHFSIERSGGALALLKNGAYGLSALDTELGTLATASALSTVDTVVDAIKAVTDAQGATGTGLSAIPWNASWDAEVQSECTDALNAYDSPTNTEMTAAFTEIKGATWAAGTDTLEHIRNKQTDIETDTQDIQTQIGTAGAGLTDLGGMSTAMKAEVNAEVVDTLATDTYAEPGQGAPAATTSIAAKINYLYKAWRNKIEQTATTMSIYDDAGTTVDHKTTVSDDGTTATKGEIVTGP